ncbi:MAG: L-Lysine--8-amino-7-oxononanoate transaminase [Candidatus Omnitrophica bacterium]|nr:L-Lysine--8-amino-7-oxononanoate transaminase [Candidatus Omnitrophota bacterium]
MKRARARRLERADKRHVWHPFTQMRDWERERAVIIERAKGNYLYDTDGYRYLDGVSSLWCNVHGHRVPELDRAVRRQLDRVAHSTFLGLSNVPAVELAERLARIAPRGLTRVFYADSGSAAVEIALKMAYQACQLRGLRDKKTFLRLTDAYHGDTIGSVSVGGIELFHEIFHPLLFKTYAVKGPYRYRDTYRGPESGYAEHCAMRVERILRRHHRKIAALVVEPLVQGAAGMLTHPRGYLRRLRQLTRKYGVYLIADEVATGFGRTGKMFACEREGVRPDFLCLAKGLTGGYLPLSATLTTEEVYRTFLGEYGEFKAFFHGHTYTANPLACAAALASLDVFERRGVIRGLDAKIGVLKAGLRTLAGLDHVGDTRQVGLMAGVELVRDKRTREPYPLTEKRGARVCLAARRQGVMLRPLGNVVVLLPPLSITAPELRRLLSVVERCIHEVTGER